MQVRVFATERFGTVFAVSELVRHLRFLPLSLVLPCFLAACGGSGATATEDAGPDFDSGSELPECPSPESDFSWPVDSRDLTVTTSDAWAPRISPDSSLVTGDTSEGGTPLRWSKWSILLEDPETVYYQDSRSDQYPFHYDFAHQHLDPFLDISRENFDAITLRSATQKISLGAVLFPTQAEQRQYGIQLVGLDPMHPKLVKDLFDRVAATVDVKGLEPVYIPSGAQAACAEANRDWYAEAGIPLGSIDAWLPGNQCYSDGWSLGKVVRLAASEVEAAVLSGELTAEDILLLEDAAPAELPAVAGILTLAPSTPNSHTAILAQSYGIPFAYLREPESAAAAEALEGKMAVIGASNPYGGCDVRLFDLTDVDQSIIDELRALNQPKALEYDAKALAGSLTQSVEGLGPDDISTVGGKAANYGLLRSTLPDNSRVAMALTMDLWDAFMAQQLPSGTTLKLTIEQRLSGFTWPPAMAELDAALAEVRDLIRDQGQFTAEQRSALEAALGSFDATQKLRFRSSTNVEDGESFTGAGLYDSAGGCLADDIDNDELGPSLCNPSKANERGIYRAIKKVYASFYRRNAFVERLRRGVREDEVGMAVLVHHSFPDATEMANGVAVIKRGFSDDIKLVSQPGAVSVANPEGNSTPEVVSGYHSLASQEVYFDMQQHSSLVPLGANVLEWEGEYKELSLLLLAVMEVFPTVESRFSLDFEFKKIEPGTLIVKQVRPLPLPDTTRDVTPLLLDKANTLCVFEGEASDVFAIHRMKALWSLRTRSAWLDTEGLSTSLLRTVEMEFVDGDGTNTVSGSPSTLPGFVHSQGASMSENSFDAGANQERRITLSHPHPEDRRRDEIPALALDELFLYAEADYQTPQPAITFQGVTTRTTDSVQLSAHCPASHAAQPGDIRVERTLDKGTVSIQTAFYWPADPGFGAGYTAPLQTWERTRITGLTSSPIVLTSTWSQTQRPEHHNFGSSYIFEPRLEPGIDASIVAELNAANIKFIYATEAGVMKIVGLDNQIRDL